MRYDNVYEINAEEYFKETEEYMERIMGNRISAYDLANGFRRINSNLSNENRSIDSSYAPERYDLPANSRFSTHDVAMLGYLTCGIGTIAKGPDSDLYESIVAGLKKSGVKENIIQKVEQCVEVGTKQMMTDSFYYLSEPRFIAGDYSQGMMEARRVVREAVCGEDLSRIAELCKKGLNTLRASFNVHKGPKAVDRYPDCYVSGQIMDLLDRNPDLDQMVGLTPEDKVYFRGMGKFADIIKAGTIAREKLDRSESLTPEERAMYEQDYRRYQDFAIMQMLEVDNIENSDEAQKINESVTNIAMDSEVINNIDYVNEAFHEKGSRDSHVMAGIMNVTMYAWAKDGRMIQQLGSLDQVQEASFWNDIHEKVALGKSTGNIPEFENLKDVRQSVSEFETNEHKVHSNEMTEVIRENMRRREEENEARRTANLLDESYREVEAYSNGKINRGDLITVGGRTIHEIMAEDYLASGLDATNFNDYYMEHVQEETERIVKEALNEGKYVEMYSVKPDGEIEESPKPISRFGDQPAQLRPEEQERVFESRERVKLINWNGIHQMYHYQDVKGISPRKKEFFGDWLEEHNVKDNRSFEAAMGTNSRRLTFDRTALESFTVLSLAQKGYSIDAIADPNQIKEAKQQAGREVIEHIQKEDYAWLGEMVIRGQKPVLDQLDEHLKEIDFSDERQYLNPKYKNLLFVAHSAFDAHQEKRKFKEELLAGAKKMDPEKAEQIIEDFDNRVTTLPALLESLDKSMDAKIQLSYGVGERDAGRMVKDIVTAEYARRLYVERQAQQKEVPLSRIFTVKDIPLIAGIGGLLSNDSKEYKELLEAMKDLEVSRIIGKEFLAGNQTEKLDMYMEDNPEKDPTLLEVSFGLDHTSQKVQEGLSIYQAKKKFKEEIKKGQRTFPDQLQKSINALEKADRWWQRNSKEYQDMQKCVLEMASTMKIMGNPPTYGQLQLMCETAEELRKTVQAYFVHKKEKKTGTRWERRRMEAANTLLNLSEQILQSGETMEHAFEKVPSLRPQIEQYWAEKQQKEEKNYESYESVMRLQNPNYDKEKEAARKQEVGDEVTGILNRCYGEKGPSVYRASGSMVQVSRPVTGEDGQKVMKKGEENAMTFLSGSIVKRKSLAADYIVGNNRTKQTEANMKELVKRIVAAEVIAAERGGAGYMNGQEQVEPREQEREFAANPKAFLNKMGEIDQVKGLLDNLTPEKLQDFIVHNKAREIAIEKHNQKVQEKRADIVKEGANTVEADKQLSEDAAKSKETGKQMQVPGK